MTAPAGKIEALERALKRIEDQSVRKIVIMAKWERGELTRLQTLRLIRKLGLVNA